MIIVKESIMRNSLVHLGLLTALVIAGSSLVFTLVGCKGSTADSDVIDDTEAGAGGGSGGVAGQGGAKEDQDSGVGGQAGGGQQDAQVDVKEECLLVGATCKTHSDCCSATCDEESKLCVVANAKCKEAGSACEVPMDCCTMVCANGICGADQCITDNQACNNDASCCSGKCTNKLCAPLNAECKTSGNACTEHTECCSKFCEKGTCDSSPSYCKQTGDVCKSNAECCTGMCTKEKDATVGLCKIPDAPGGTGCTAAGQVCGIGASATGGEEPPPCGGECCSRSCAPYGPTGVWVCQPASGCRSTGEVCRSDKDCCGSKDNPGGGNGSVKCSKSSADQPVGRCDNGTACRAAGSVCKLADYSCNAENDCCAGNVNKKPNACKRDMLGIPRCTLSDKPCDPDGNYKGIACSSSADCCGLPCVPNTNPEGPAFVCGADDCIPKDGACTTDADCCFALPCVIPPGKDHGVCGYGVIIPPADGGVPDGSTPDGGKPDGGTTCAYYGQQCETSEDCCNEVPCTGGRCMYEIK